MVLPTWAAPGSAVAPAAALPGWFFFRAFRAPPATARPPDLGAEVLDFENLRARIIVRERPRPDVGRRDGSGDWRGVRGAEAPPEPPARRSIRLCRSIDSKLGAAEGGASSSQHNLWLCCETGCAAKRQLTSSHHSLYCGSSPRDGAGVHLGDGHRLGTGARDRPVVHGVDRADLGGGAADEDLVGDVQVAAGEVVDPAVEAEVTGDRHHGVLRDALERTRRQWRRDEDPVAARRRCSRRCTRRRGRWAPA